MIRQPGRLAAGPGSRARRRAPLVAPRRTGQTWGRARARPVPGGAGDGRGRTTNQRAHGVAQALNIGDGCVAKQTRELVPARTADGDRHVGGSRGQGLQPVKAGTVAVRDGTHVHVQLGLATAVQLLAVVGDTRHLGRTQRANENDRARRLGVHPQPTQVVCAPASSTRGQPTSQHDVTTAHQRTVERAHSPAAPMARCHGGR